MELDFTPQNQSFQCTRCFSNSTISLKGLEEINNSKEKQVETGHVKSRKCVLCGADTRARLSKAGLQTSLLDANRDVMLIPLGARRYSIADEWIRLFVYPSSACAQADGSRLDSRGYTYNGILYSVMMSYANRGPHFYIDDNIIVFYCGSNSTLLSAFDKLFGPQFAGD